MAGRSDRRPDRRPDRQRRHQGGEHEEHDGHRARSAVGRGTRPAREHPGRCGEAQQHGGARPGDLRGTRHVGRVGTWVAGGGEHADRGRLERDQQGTGTDPHLAQRPGRVQHTGPRGACRAGHEVGGRGEPELCGVLRRHVRHGRRGRDHEVHHAPGAVHAEGEDVARTCRHCTSRSVSPRRVKGSRSP